MKVWYEIETVAITDVPNPSREWHVYWNSDHDPIKMNYPNRQLIATFVDSADALDFKELKEQRQTKFEKALAESMEKYGEAYKKLADM